ncbi:MAG: type II and III secretion system protein family protein [Phenylobacterium sp.]|uniref:type II and III secretion system protein family protein n=1 Tax=Phenylobacterium sp. TaxID=1871053 RepID=UPI0027325D73|nr:type II and III secretion system protein family protein [Phenylobacterium sp.]MDP3175272.1 type II and III secretion system protein family protein [Phenylobacterium sp.]
MICKFVLPLALLAAALAPMSASAQSVTQNAGLAMSSDAAAASSVVRVNLAGAGAAQSLSLPKGKSAIVELPTDARDVLVTNPTVADAVLRTPRRIYVMGIAAGQTDAVFFDAAGRRILSLDIRVDQDTSATAQTINRLLPGSAVRVDAMNDSIILSGQVPSLADADRAVQIARASVGKDDQVVNLLGIAGKDQVMLKVRMVEMERSVIKQLGFDINAVLNQVGEPQFIFGKSATFGVNGSLLGGLTGGLNFDSTKGPVMQVPCGYPPPNEAVQCDIISRSGGNSDTATVKSGLAGDPGLNQATSMIKAFERVGLVRTLAEPNLTAVSGESAKFLAGGEFPVPVGQDNDGRVTVEFKPFGVGLGFTPVVLSGGRISLKISTEVSELTAQGAFSIGNGSGAPGLTIPALNVRRAETMVELPSGGSMMIAGLLREQTRQNLDSLPGMMNLPVLGTLFRSRDYLSGETELVIIVTPYLVGATNPAALQTPADGFKIASDPETVLLGRINHAYKAKPAPAAAPSYQGPYGYVIE